MHEEAKVATAFFLSLVSNVGCQVRSAHGDHLGGLWGFHSNWMFQSALGSGLSLGSS